MDFLVVCHRPLLRALLVSVCDSAGFSVSQSCASIDDIDRLGDDDIVLLHVFEDTTNVGRSIARLRSLSSSARIELIAPDRMVEQLQADLGAEVSAIIPESITAIDLFTSSLKMVANGYRLMPGGVTLPKAIARNETRSLERGFGNRTVLDTLSKRELAILTRLCDGVPNKTIATDLGISEGTVKVHLRTIFRKTGVTNRTQAALWGKGRV